MQRVPHGTVQTVSRRGDQLVITNRKARHDYFVMDSWECGIMLAGPEVKSVREGRANLQDSFVRVEDSSPFGAGWSLSSVDQLVSVSGGVMYVYGTGLARFWSGGPSFSASAPIRADSRPRRRWTGS